MSYENCGPERSSYRPAPKTESHPTSYTAPTAVQEPRVPSEAERRLVAAGWRDPAQLACDADQLGLYESDFDDRLCGVAVGYLRSCGEGEVAPTRVEAEAWLTHFAVPHDPSELGSILSGTFVPDGDTLADLIDDVLRESQQRSAELFRKLCRDGLRAMMRGLNCPHCRAERSEQRRSAGYKPRERRVVYAR